MDSVIADLIKQVTRTEMTCNGHGKMIEHLVSLSDQAAVDREQAHRREESLKARIEALERALAEQGG